MGACSTEPTSRARRSSGQCRTFALRVRAEYLAIAAPVNGAGGFDYPYLRYADVLLSAAEAINNSTGPNSEAYGYVNQVRARAKVPNMTAGLTQAAFRDSLSVERRFEL